MRNLHKIKMKQLNRFQSILFAIGGMLMVIGAGCFAFMWQQQVVCWLFLAGASMFTLMQSMQTYEGSNFVIRRLKRIQAVANIFFMLAGILMVDTAYMFFRPLFNSSIMETFTQVSLNVALLTSI